MMSDHDTCAICRRTAAKHMNEFLCAGFFGFSLQRCTFSQDGPLLGASLSSSSLRLSGKRVYVFGGKDSWESHNRPSPPRFTGGMRALILHYLRALLTLSLECSEARRNKT